MYISRRSLSVACMLELGALAQAREDNDSSGSFGKPRRSVTPFSQTKKRVALGKIEVGALWLWSMHDQPAHY